MDYIWSCRHGWTALHLISAILQSLTEHNLDLDWLWSRVWAPYLGPVKTSNLDLWHKIKHLKQQASSVSSWSNLSLLFCPQSGHCRGPPVLQEQCSVLPGLRWKLGVGAAVLPAGRRGAVQSRRLQPSHRLPSLSSPHRGGAGGGLLRERRAPWTIPTHLWTSRKPLQ